MRWLLLLLDLIEGHLCRDSLLLVASIYRISHRQAITCLNLIWLGLIHHWDVFIRDLARPFYFLNELLFVCVLFGLWSLHLPLDFFSQIFLCLGSFWLDVLRCRILLIALRRGLHGITDLLLYDRFGFLRFVHRQLSTLLSRLLTAPLRCLFFCLNRR